MVLAKFFQALKDNNTERCQSLINQLFTNDFSDEDYQVCLSNAITHQNIEICKALLKHRSPTRLSSTDANTLLCMAIMQGNVAIARALLEHGFFSSSSDDDDKIPLIIALDQGNLEMCRAIFEHGAFGRSFDKCFNMYVDKAANQERFDICDLILSYAEHLDNHHEKTIAISALRNKVSAIHTLNKNLITAIKHENLPMVNKWLDMGASANACDNNDVSAFVIATKKENVEICRVLANKGANVDAKDENGTLAMLIAGIAGNREIMDIIIEKPNHDAQPLNKDSRQPKDQPDCIDAPSLYSDHHKNIPPLNTPRNSSKDSDQQHQRPGPKTRKNPIRRATKSFRLRNSRSGIFVSFLALFSAGVYFSRSRYKISASDQLSLSPNDQKNRLDPLPLSEFPEQPDCPNPDIQTAEKNTTIQNTSIISLGISVQ